MSLQGEAAVHLSLCDPRDAIKLNAVPHTEMTLSSYPHVPGRQRS